MRRVDAERRGSRRLQRLIDAFVGDVAVLPFDEAAADRLGKVAAVPVPKATAIGALGAMIAAQALQLALTPVTHDVKPFRRVRGLDLEDWL